MVVVEPFKINNEVACSLKVLSHLPSNKRKKKKKKERRKTKSIVIKTAPSSPLVPFYPSLFHYPSFSSRSRDDDRGSELSGRTIS